ncbi:uncharacterized protein LOC122520383 [Polistes fuscatus]|uniref:uncharacterized protein LOC122520383 n=1 Tax=Polistes fuscatus TaxID=30207 RepID=UPI001CA7F223|nr:uncharacterized protein LOC122520383 [Polistes fuscatus]
MSLVRQRFWSPGLRNTIKGHIRKCVTCLRQKAVTFSPSMGHVPAVRFGTSKPFERTGIDFAGPYNVRPYKGRGKIGMKAYLAIMVCLTTKAVHLELVCNLSTDSLILALQRFISRRGHCSEIMSDNGRNFLGLSRCLNDSRREISRVIMDDEVKKFLLGNLMNGNLSPILASFRRHMGGRKEMTTVLTQIEAILNSRPILSMTDEVEDLEVLTPSHLLSGHPVVDIPVVAVHQKTKPISELRAYQNLKSRISSFWRNWRHSYMQSLLKKSRWISEGRSPEIGELTRVVEVKTAKGFTRESARNLVPLNLKLDASTGGNCTDVEDLRPTLGSG